ncbi:sensor histidine kinase [Exiguobacterium marinum]|uniref:sensor histidine kinase n=1 Tax=Exiguobacterium marinum TaxID=273528 RepID=UPI003898EB54
MESGKQTYHNEPERLSVILEQAITVHQGSSQHHRITFDCQEDVYVYGDRTRLGQLFTNLLHNAVKYSPKGGDINVRVAYERPDWIDISIEDHGIGIPQTALPKLFDKFYRVDNSASRKIGGTGLGLAICKEIAEGHGGAIHATSNIGKGSIFTVSLPKMDLSNQMSS